MLEKRVCCSEKDSRHMSKDIAALGVCVLDPGGLLPAGEEMLLCPFLRTGRSGRRPASRRSLLVFSGVSSEVTETKRSRNVPGPRSLSPGTFTLAWEFSLHSLIASLLPDRQERGQI